MITTQRIAKAAGKHATRAILKMRAGLGASPHYHCPACDRDVVGFFRYGEVADWGCPRCGASPRERLMHWLLDAGRLAIPAGAAILHMAPNEASLVQRFSAAAGDYVPADLHPERYRVPGVQPVDLMKLDMQDRFDLIYASHVMEHVPDDARVLANLHAALKPHGEAWLLVPLWDGPTEDGSFDMPPRERERRFGQWDHVRQYGPDFAERIAAAGFTVERLDAADAPADAAAHMALGDVVFRAMKCG